MLTRYNNDTFRGDWQFPTCSEDTRHGQFVVRNYKTVTNIQNTPAIRRKEASNPKKQYRPDQV